MKIGGKTINNWWLVGGAAGAGIVFYLYEKNKSGSAASSSGTSGSAIDPLTGLPYSEDNTVDPLTGLTYLAEAQQYGSVAAAEAAVSGGSAYGAAGESGYSGTAGYPTSNVGTTGSTGSYATNAAWAQAVTSGLTGLGYSSTDVAAALGLFFAGQPLGTAPDGVSYASIVQAAEAEYGPPPQGTYSIIPEPSSGGATGTSTGGGSTSPPGPPSWPAGTGGGGTEKGGPITVIPVDLHITQVSATSVGVAWIAPTIPAGQGPLTGYTAEVYEASGRSEGPSWTVPATQLYANAGGLKPKTAYHLNVWCEPARTGGPHASVSFTTK